MNTFVSHRLNGLLANIIFLIILKKAYFILRPSLIRPTWIKASCFLIWLLWTFNALGQSKETPRQPIDGPLYPHTASVPAQRDPERLTVTHPPTPPSAKKARSAGLLRGRRPAPTLPNSQQPRRAGKSELNWNVNFNQKYSAPNRLGPTQTDEQTLLRPLPALQQGLDSLAPAKPVYRGRLHPRITPVRFSSASAPTPKPVRPGASPVLRARYWFRHPHPTG